MVVVLVIVGLWVLVGVPAAFVAYAVTSPTFAPRPELAWARWVVKLLVVVPGGMLIASLTRTWYVVDRPGGLEVADSSSRVVQAIVGLGVAAGVCTLIGVHGRRNLSLPLLIVAYFLLAGCWSTATAWFGEEEVRMETYRFEEEEQVTREVGAGLEVATQAIVAMTFVAGLGGLVRTAERRTSTRAGVTKVATASES